DLVLAHRITRTEADIFVDREAETNASPSALLRIGVIALVCRCLAVAVIFAAEDFAAQQDVLVEQIGLGEAQVHRSRITRPVDAGADLLALAHEIALRDGRG